MNTRIAATAFALALVAGAPASTAFAQDYGYGARAGAPVQASRSILGVPSWVFERQEAADEALTTGSIVRRRGVDASAKGGNAAQQDRLVPQYGTTSGGPVE